MKIALLNILSASLLILLFSYTGVDKLWQHEVFAKVLLQVPLLAGASGFISIALPLLELLIAILLFFPATRLAGFYASLVLLTTFTLYLIYMILFLDHLPCSCGGVVGSMTWKEHIVFNLFFIALAWAGIYSSNPVHQHIHESGVAENL